MIEYVTPDIRPDETRPYDIWFDVPGAVTISSIAVVMYDTSVDAKTDISGTNVVASGVAGDFARVVLSGLTIGKTYYLGVNATLTDGQSRNEARLVRCQYHQTVLSSIPENKRQTYELDFSDDLPTGVNLASSTDQAYDETDATATDVSAIIVDAVVLDGQEAAVSFNNCTAGVTYVYTILATTATDSVTSYAYIIGKCVILPCKERQ